jgi:predicted RNA methylase
MSQRNSGFERIANDLYETPAWVTNVLLDAVSGLPHRVWEPACGNGKISNALGIAGFEVTSSDILDRGYSLQTSRADFLSTNKLPGEGRWAIITNPPFGARGTQALYFIRHALDLTKACNGSVCMLLPCDFDHAASRYDVFGHCPAFAGKVVLTKRIRWIEDSTGSPSQNFAWFCWNWLNQHAPGITYGPIPTKDA